MVRRARAPFDPLDAAYRAGQEIYKQGLLTVVNARRRALGRKPAAWPEVGATPAEERWSEGSARLFRYRIKNDARASKSGAPLLLVCSLINRPYILDLIEERSVARRLLDSGRDVWLLDWGRPSADDARRGLDEYALDLLPRAAAAVLAETNSPSLHVLGYCMGGTLALCALGAGRLPAASLVALATPVALRDSGLLSAWCRAPGFDPEEVARVYGNVPPHLTGPAFKMLDPVGLATKFTALESKAGDDDFIRFFLAMETWLEDSVAFPGCAFADWVGLYRQDALVGGRFTLGGRAVELGRVACPILNIVAEGDYITPPESSEALERVAPRAPYELIRMSGGHIGLSTGGAAHKKLWPRVAEWLSAHEPPLDNLMRMHKNSARSGANMMRAHKKRKARS